MRTVLSCVVPFFGAFFPARPLPYNLLPASGTIAVLYMQQGYFRARALSGSGIQNIIRQQSRGVGGGSIITGIYILNSGIFFGLLFAGSTVCRFP